MCGRFVQKYDLSKIAPLFKAVLESDVQPSYNIAPRQPMAVVMEKGQRKIVTMSWGLIPHWAKDAAIANKLINARSETVTRSPASGTHLKNAGASSSPMDSMNGRVLDWPRSLSLSA